MKTLHALELLFRPALINLVHVVKVLGTAALLRRPFLVVHRVEVFTVWADRGLAFSADVTPKLLALLTCYVGTSEVFSTTIAALWAVHILTVFQAFIPTVFKFFVREATSSVSIDRLLHVDRVAHLV